MALDRLKEDMNFVGNLGDDPKRDNGLSTPQFKSYFDKAGLVIQNFINNKLIPQIENAIEEGALLQQVTAAINRKLDKSGGLMTGGIDMNGNKITNLSEPVNSKDPATKSYTETYAEKKALRFYDVVVPASSFVSDYTNENFAFRAAVALRGVTAQMIPDVYFSFDDAVSGNFAPVGATYNGGVYIYAEQAATDITIPAIICRTEG